MRNKAVVVRFTWSFVFVLMFAAVGCKPCSFEEPGQGEGISEGAVEGEGSLPGEGVIEPEGAGEGEGQRPPEGAPEPVCIGDCSYAVVGVYPHDREAFTQGLEIDNGVLYEGTGGYGASTLRKVDLESGVVYQIHDLREQFFGEGITVFGNELFQLTWRNNRGFVYDKNTFEVLREVTYGTEGWGLTHDATRLIMSDGTSTLYFRDPATFEEIGQVVVRDGDRPVSNLNELEYVRGAVFANIWQANRIAKISPSTGRVTGWILLDGLLPQEDRPGADVLNGIAYDEAADRLFVTGKRWPKLFEIKLIPLK